mmetsp:Transcript_104625/g.180330  ORF Transcript_104625/g.180330 Transcript_104625/m.180330 type:complete len:122 (+) Transcript_104625:1416-1781(+)
MLIVAKTPEPFGTWYYQDCVDGMHKCTTWHVILSQISATMKSRHHTVSCSLEYILHGHSDLPMPTTPALALIPILPPVMLMKYTLHLALALALTPTLTLTFSCSPSSGPHCRPFPAAPEQG